ANGGVRRNRVSCLDDETHRLIAVRPAVARRVIITRGRSGTPISLTPGRSAPLPVPPINASKYFESPSRVGAGQTLLPGDRISSRNKPRKERSDKRK
ncbi:unnamed protein product, partial [Musa acuminata subsp. burmannicoides]